MPIKLQIPDRTNDKLPPEDRNQTAPCQCGAQMVGRIDRANQHQGYLRWYWWCGGCGSVVDGGTWHPQTADEAVYERWKKANPS